MMKFYKLLFVMTLMLSTLITICSYSWMGMWMGLEINLISMIPLMNSSKNLLSSESSIKYFITQAIASITLIFSIIMIMSLNFTESNVLIKINLSMIMNSSILMKMGSAPFHFWFPEVMEGLNWINSMIMLTWQKIAPMMMFSYNEKPQMFMIFIVIASMVVSGIMGLNQLSIRKILAFSSINHIGWMISLMMVSETSWMVYFAIYMIININMTMLLWKSNILMLNQLNNSLNNKSTMKFSFMINFLSLGGIPPFIGFLPKWIAIQSLLNESIYTLTLIMIILTMMTLYMYTRIMTSSILMKSSEINWMKNYFMMKYSFSIKLNFLINILLVLCASMFNWI